MNIISPAIGSEDKILYMYVFEHTQCVMWSSLSDGAKLTSVGKSHFPDVYFGHCRNGILTDSVMKNTLLL